MKKVNNRIIKGVLCLVTLSTMLIGQNNILTKGYAQDTYSEVAGESHTGSFSVDSLTLQPGATTTSINQSKLVCTSRNDGSKNSVW